MFRGNLQHTGVYDAAGIAKFSKVKWKFKVNGYAISSPAVGGHGVHREHGWKSVCCGHGNRSAEVEVSNASACDVLSRC